MGPRASARGNVVWEQTVQQLMELQWGHERALVEIREALRHHRAADRRFTGATSARSWKSAGACESGTTRSRFNGATSARSWKSSARRAARVPRSRFNG